MEAKFVTASDQESKSIKSTIIIFESRKSATIDLKPIKAKQILAIEKLATKRTRFNQIITKKKLTFKQREPDSVVQSGIFR